MPRKLNRAYKKGSPHRDHRKFIIVAEGEREDDYFRFFNAKNQRIIISIVARDGGKSACKHFLERVRKYDDEFGIEPNDQLWFILDVDKWLRSDIDELAKHCVDTPNREIAISNPCFEVWLYFHFGDPAKLTELTPQSIKTSLHTLIPGGYKREVFAPEIEKATAKAEKADKNPIHYFPDPLTTKVYKLSAQMLQFTGKSFR